LILTGFYLILTTAEGNNNESLCMISIVLNHKGEIIHVTDSIKTILGYDSRDLIGHSMFGLLPSGRQQNMKLRFEWFISRDNLTTTIVVPVKHKSGSVRRLALTIRNLSRHVEITL
jgi:PAS domain S-box-containing protein